VVANADLIGSTEMIIKSVTESPAGTKWAVGTELNLVSRLAKENPDKQVIFLDKTICYCSTMNRIDLPHLVWAMESLLLGRVVNQIKVDSQVAKYAKVALNQMLALP
jgi:quinolinate synthase